MTDLPITLDTLETLAGIVLGCLTIGCTVGGAVLKAGVGLRRELSGQIEKNREATAFQIETIRTESNEGRKRMHQRLDDLRDHLDTNFVRRDRYEADQRAVQHALAETQQIVTLAARPCAARPD